jgi:hypothetical protein
MARRASLAGIAVLVACCFATVSGAEPISVARPVLSSGLSFSRKGVAFFVETPDGAIAAIGTAHTLELGNVATAGRVEFRVGNSEEAAAVSTGFLVAPGKPFSNPGGSMEGDYFVYAIGNGASDVTPLRVSPETPEARAAVRVVGIPAKGPDPSLAVRGTVARVLAGEIHIDLESPVDLRGWGGAPVISEASGAVIGFVQAAAVEAALPRITAAPIGAVWQAIGKRAAGDPVLAFDGFHNPQSPVANHFESGEPQTTIEPVILPVEAEGVGLELDIEFPVDGLVMSDSVCGAFVAGRAMAVEDGTQRFDVAIVLDTSQSTDEPTGADINGNGIIGTRHLGRLDSLFGNRKDDPGDSILAAEVAAARQLLRGLDPRTTRVTLVTFSGGYGSAFGTSRAIEPAVTHTPLTHDFAQVEAALERILESGGVGQTNFAAGVRFGAVELNGLTGAISDPREGSSKLMFFFTDGEPTEPHGVDAQTDNYLAVTREATRARDLGVRVHSFAIGPLAVTRPIATVSMADITGGYFTPVRHPGELSEIIDAVGFASLDDVTIRSVTTGDGATPFRMSADGSWGGFVQLEPGANHIEVSAISSDGIAVVQSVRVVSEPAAEPAAIPPDLAVRHNRLLEDCLRNAKTQRAAAEQAHAEKVRRDLMLEIEKERADARRRADEQRKTLELEVEE